mgnify:CR=1 FL=1
MGKEDLILKKVGTKNPFNVPDGYFDNFTKELMNQLPEKEIVMVSSEITLWQRVKPWVYMTAMFCGIMLSVRVFVGEPQKDEFPAISQIEAENLTDEDWEIMIDHIMMDDYSLYQYLTNADFNPNN